MSLPFKILGINHLGIAPKDPDLFESFLSGPLGLSTLGVEDVPSEKTSTAIYASQAENGPSDANLLEVLRPLTPGEGPIADFLTQRGSGIHHLALSVDNVVAAAQYLREQGIRLINNEPKGGVCNTQIVFIHPKDTGGVLIELVQNPLVQNPE